MRIFRFLWALIKYIFIGNKVSNKVHKDRLSICYSCSYLSNTTCSICGCYVKKKTKWSTESCPKNKW